MQTRIKTPVEIEAMRKGGKVLAGVLYELEKVIQPGVTGEMIDRFTETYIRDHGMIPGFKGLYKFPATVCLAINHEVVHGIPRKNQVVKEGDKITVDCGVIYEGMYTDSAVTYCMGNVESSTRTFVKICQKALYKGIAQVRPGNHLGDIGNAIETVVTNGGYHVIKDLVGHGIGEHLHEEPHVPNHGKKGSGIALKPGYTFAIEPIIGMNTGEIVTLEDGWTIVTQDHTLACQWEHTILVTESGVEILTLRPNETMN